MNPADAEAVAEYLKDGGHIVKVQEAVLASDQDVIAYLAACGHRARYCEGDFLGYVGIMPSCPSIRSDRIWRSGGDL